MTDQDALTALSPQDLSEHLEARSGTSDLLDVMDKPGLGMRLELASDAASETSKTFSKRLFAISALSRKNFRLARSEFDALVDGAPEAAHSSDVLGLVRALIGLGQFARAGRCLEAHRPETGWEAAFQWEAVTLAVLRRDYGAAWQLANMLAADAQSTRASWLLCYLDTLAPKEAGSGKVVLPMAQRRAIKTRLDGADQARGKACLIGLYDYKTPDLKASSMNIGDTMQTLAMLRHVVRHFGAGGLTADDEALGPSLMRLAGTWQGTEREARMAASAPSAHIALVDRDFPERVGVTHPGREIILIMHGWFLHKVFGQVRAFDLPGHVKPFVISFYLQRGDDLTEEAIAFLKAHEPIGCRDWSTTDLLLNQGIAAFFSGCVTTTLGGEIAPERGARELHVDLAGPSDGAVDLLEQNVPHYRTMQFAEGIETCLSLLSQYQGAARVRTSRLHCALPATAIGAEVAFEGKDPADRRFEGLIGLDGAIDPEAFGATRHRVKELIDLIYGGVSAGKGHEALRDEWGHATAPYVAEARARLEKTAALFEVRGGAARQPRTPAKSERVNLAVAFDLNILAHARPLLRSIAANTKAALRVFALTREVSEQAFADLQGDFPGIELTQLRMDGHLADVDVHLQDQITVSTMDRLSLPELLPEVDRLVYLDIDVTVCGDIQELARTRLGHKGVGARATPNPAHFLLSHWIERDVRLGRLAPADARVVRRAVAAHGNLLGRFVNAGVLVLSLKALRAQGFTSGALSLVRRYGFDDQMILNLYLQGDFADIGASWNLQPYFEPCKQPRLLHWAGARKPWQRKRAIRKAEVWARWSDPAGAPDWKRAESYPKGWAKRAERAAQWFPKAGLVADIGCGPHLALAEFLGPEATYAPYDQRAWTPEVGVVDLESDPFPQGPFEAVVMLGVLEYLQRPGAVLRRASKQSDLLITSYVHPVGPKAGQHRKQMGWINQFSEDRLQELMFKHGWEITERQLFSEADHSRQILYRAKAL